MIAGLDESEVADICRKNDIAFLGVFGSYARGEARPGSDIDLLARFAKPKNLLELVRIERELGKRLGRRVDLVTEDAISPYLRERIEAEVRPVYEQQG